MWFYISSLVVVLGDSCVEKECLSLEVCSRYSGVHVQVLSLGSILSDSIAATNGKLSPQICKTDVERLLELPGFASKSLNQPWQSETKSSHQVPWFGHKFE